MTLKPKAPSTRPPPPQVGPSVRPPSNLKDALSEARAMTGAGIQRASGTPGAFAPAGKKTIIIVDDDASQRARLRSAAELYYDVVEAKDGMEAVELVAKIPAPAMIICDVVMPRVDGFTLAKIMKSNPNTKRIPIMFVSSRNSPQDVTQALVLGACHYFPKTTAVGEIVAKIRKIVL